MLPLLGGLCLLAAASLLLSRLPAWLAVSAGVVALLSGLLPARRLLAVCAIELVEPDLLRCYTPGCTEPVADSLRGWLRLGPWIVLHAAEGGRLPLWLPGLTPASRQALLRTLARCRAAAGS